MKLLLLLLALTATSLAKPQNWFSSLFETSTTAASTTGTATGRTATGGNSWQNVLDIVIAKMAAETAVMKAEMEAKMAAETAVMRAEMEAKLAKKDAEIQAKLDKKDAEIEKKVESAVAEAVRDMPYEMVSVYKHSWSTPNTTITYDTYLSDYNNSERPGGGEGTLDLSTGIFTCRTPGHYTVTYSGSSHLLPEEYVIIYLWVNGERVVKSMYLESASSDLILTQGSRSLILHLSLGDTLELRTDPAGFTGSIYRLILNIALTAPDSLDSRTTNTTRTISAEIEKLRAEMEANLAKKDAEIQAKLDKKDAEIEKKVESAVRDLPYEMVSVYKTFWYTPNTTITYDSYLSDYNNSERPGGGEGTLDLSTGIFTCRTPGHYTVTYSGSSHLDPGQMNMIYLWVNGERVAESRYLESAYSEIGGPIFSQGSQSLILHLDLGDTLELRTDHFTGRITQFILNIALTAPDSLDSRTQDLEARTISAP